MIMAIKKNKTKKKQQQQQQEKKNVCMLYTLNATRGTAA